MKDLMKIVVMFWIVVSVIGTFVGIIDNFDYAYDMIAVQLCAAIASALFTLIGAIYYGIKNRKEKQAEKVEVIRN